VAVAVAQHLPRPSDPTTTTGAGDFQKVPPGPVTLGFASLTVSVDQTQSDGSVQGAPSVRIPVKPN
jgi:hypothetical protein